MLNDIFLSYTLLKLKGKARGAAMTEYAILLAFIAAIAVGVFYVDWYDLVPGEDRYTVKGRSLFTAIYASIMNIVSVFYRI